MNIEISIIVPFFNRIELLKKTIQSVLNQTYDKWELILVDDGSDEDIAPFLLELNTYAWMKFDQKLALLVFLMILLLLFHIT